MPRCSPTHRGPDQAQHPPPPATGRWRSLLSSTRSARPTARSSAACCAAHPGPPEPCCSPLRPLRVGVRRRSSPVTTAQNSAPEQRRLEPDHPCPVDPSAPLGHCVGGERIDRSGAPLNGSGVLRRSHFVAPPNAPQRSTGKSGPGAPSMAEVPAVGHPAPVWGLPAHVSVYVKVREKFGESFLVGRCLSRRRWSPLPRPGDR